MKKILFLIATFAYFTSISGASIYVHECMGKVIDWSFQEKENDKCENCGMHKNAANDCCKDAIKILKVNADQKQSENIAPVYKIADVLLPVFYLIIDRQLVTPTTPAELSGERIASATPPDLNILYCNFRI
ncbi:MAG: hypothetical protein ABI266_05270 [Ginsengibacter sp.]